MTPTPLSCCDGSASNPDAGGRDRLGYWPRGGSVRGGAASFWGAVHGDGRELERRSDVVGDDVARLPSVARLLVGVSAEPQVAGDDPFGAFLDETVRNETVRGRRLAVRRYTSVDEASQAHLLVVSRSERGRLPEIIAGLRGKGVLTVSDIDRFTALVVVGGHRWLR